MITTEVSKKVINVGERFESNHGGISAVINAYSKYFSVFNFISTYKPQPAKILIIPYFAYSILTLIKKLFVDKEVKLVHIHGAAKGSFFRKIIVFIISAYIFNKKVIYHVHGSEFKVFYTKSPWILQKVIEFFVNNVDLIICLSSQWEEFFRENFKIKSITVLENIIESAPLGKRLRIPSNVLRLLFLGAIGERKGIFDLVDLIHLNRKQLDGKLKLTIGGSGETKRLEKFIKINRLESIIDFQGWIGGPQKQSLLAESDVYILPSYNEGLPIAILEAMSYNLPVISTNVGGITTVIHHNINGFILQPGDKIDLLSKIMQFIEDPKLIETMGKASEEIISPYYASSVIPKLELIYLKILNKK